MPAHPASAHPPVVVTRPQPEAGLWTQQLQQLGHDARALPMLDIRRSDGPATQAALRGLLSQIGRFRALMFVSPAAVRHFFAQPLVRDAMQAHGLPGFHHVAGHDAGPDSGSGPRYWAPGAGTRRALLAQGIPANLLDAPPEDAPQFDSEALWPVVQPQLHSGDAVVIVRGSDDGASPSGSGRAWLGEQLTRAGVHLHWLAVYERHAPETTPQLCAQLHALLGHPGGAAWLVSSTQCLTHLHALAAQAALGTAASIWKPHTAITTHARIAQAAQRCGFGQVLCVPPTVPAVHAALRGTGTGAAATGDWHALAPGPVRAR